MNASNSLTNVTSAECQSGTASCPCFLLLLQHLLSSCWLATRNLLSRVHRGGSDPRGPGRWSRKEIWGTPHGHLAIGRPNKTPNVCRRRPGKKPIGSTVTHVLCNSTIGADAVIGPSLPRCDAALGKGFSYVYCATMYPTALDLFQDVTGQPRHNNV
jgi:hypothetical protein